MRNLRTLFALSLCVGSLGVSIAACGGDDSSSNPPDTTNPDSSTNPKTDGSTNPPTDGSTQDVQTQAPSAKATSVTVYIGSVAKLDATASTGPATLAYAWTIVSAPQGSAIATGSLVGAATATPSFTPDKVGTYTLALTLSSSSSTATSKVNATVTVVDPPIFYYETTEDSGVSGVRLLVSGATETDAAAAKPVACFDRDAGGTYSGYARQTATAGTDWWEAPAGQPSKAAFIMEAFVDGGQAAALYATTTAGSCGAAPTRLDYVPPPQNGHAFEQPRISPDGSRVAYVRQGPEGARVATIGFDGTNQRILSARFADPDGGPNPDAGLSVPFARPFWIGTTHVAWIEQLSNTDWQVVRVADAANGVRELVMSCTGQLPQQGAILATGEVLVSQGTNAGLQLLAYPITAGTKVCGTPRVLTPNEDGGSISANDFVLSPDGKEVAFSVFESTPSGSVTETRVVKVDGSGPMRRVSNLPGAVRGPRYVGAGSFLSWGMPAGSAVDAGHDAGVIVVASADAGPDGGELKAIPVDGTTIESIGNGIFSCGIGNAAGSGVAFFGIGAIAALRLVRRRRR